MARRTWLKSSAIAGAIGVAAVASAPQTLAYRYDAQGRLVAVEHKGDASGNVTVQYDHDKAGNRTNVKVSGSPNPSPP